MRVARWMLLLALISGCAKDPPSRADLVMEREQLYRRANSRNDADWAQERARYAEKIGRIETQLSE